ncbi:polysulfide reductase NrfD [Robiginitalea sp. SC105]|nr:polysulfide reductase NrfD [Robiginitalea sp. SC105]
MEAQKEILEKLAPRKFTRVGKVWVACLLAIILASLIAYGIQLQKGLVVTGMRDYALWGVYISNFVFFVAISLVGSLISAVLHLSGAKWATPLTRISEIIAVAAIVMAGLTIIIDMGRPERLFFLFTHGRLQSPIIWDVIVITTYLVISLLLLYYPMLPDFALLKRYFKDRPKLSRRFAKLSLNWNNSERQKKLYRTSIQMLSVLIIPVAFGIHTVTAWLFATTYRPGWDSTNFGPYFIAGAFVAGAGAVIAVMYVIRRAYGLEKFITDMHFDRMGRLLVLLCLVYLYFNVNEYLVPAYKNTVEEAQHLQSLFTGAYSTYFWFVTAGGLVMPIVLLVFPRFRKPMPLFVISLVVVVSAWWKRYLIVTPTLLHPFLPIEGVPESWHHYFPTGLEWTVTFGTLAMALLIITLLVRILPIVPIHHAIEEREASTAKNREL